MWSSLKFQNYKPSTNALAGKTEGTSYLLEVRSFPLSFKGVDGARKCMLFPCKADLIQRSNNIHPQNSKQRKSLKMEEMKNKRTEGIKMIQSSQMLSNRS